MKLTSFLKPENVQFNVEVSSKKRALELVGQLVADSLNRDLVLDQQWQDLPAENCGSICAVECFGNLFKREKLGCTSLNYGVALPHAKLPENALVEIDEPIAVCLKLASAIDYEAADHKDVDLIFALMFPSNCESYRGYLSKVAQKLADKALIKQLRQAESADKLWQLLDGVSLDD